MDLTGRGVVNIRLVGRKRTLVEFLRKFGIGQTFRGLFIVGRLRDDQCGSNLGDVAPADSVLCRKLGQTHCGRPFTVLARRKSLTAEGAAAFEKCDGENRHDRDDDQRTDERIASKLFHDFTLAKAWPYSTG